MSHATWLPPWLYSTHVEKVMYIYSRCIQALCVGCRTGSSSQKDEKTKKVTAQRHASKTLSSCQNSSSRPAARELDPPSDLATWPSPAARALLTARPGLPATPANLAASLECANNRTPGACRSPPGPAHCSPAPPRSQHRSRAPQPAAAPHTTA